MLQFNTTEKYLLEDDFALLRPLEEKDFVHLLPFALQEPNTWQYSIQQAIGEEGLKNYIANTLEARKKGLEYPFIVYDKTQRTYAGSTRFYNISNWHQNLSLGYTWYGAKHRGTGLNKHCKFLLLSFAFEHCKAMRVEFHADFENKHSIRAMKSIGCVEEGVLRQSMKKPDGQWRDTIVLSILQSEWLERVKTLIAGQL
ncbi:MAG: N-acetyltransferase [Cytophagales bacterium]|nr:MAG: N-acetyltransferase [Cytophagales bacterium]